MIGYSSVEEVIESDTVIEQMNPTTLRVQPYGNAYFFSKLYDSDNIRVGNLSTYENGDIKVNIKSIK